MDDGFRIETYKQFLRIRYRTASTTPDVNGLKKLVDAIGTGEAGDSVLITSQSFEGGQSAGQVMIEPLAKLRAAMDVLAEVDPTNTPAERPDYAYARFGGSQSSS